MLSSFIARWVEMLRIIYRTYGGENRKRRPTWYSKALCLASLLAARRQLSASAVYVLSDGSISPALSHLVSACDCVRQLIRPGNAESLLAALTIGAVWPKDDVIYLVEDDYVHTPDALIKLAEAFAETPADYVTLYDHPDRYVGRDLPLHTNAVYQSRSHTWRTVESTCMTFAARARTLREDVGVFLAHVVPGQTPRDRALFRNLQGLGPYTRSRCRRVLLGALPSLATHCEAAHLAPGVQWQNVAAQFGAKQVDN